MKSQSEKAEKPYRDNYTLLRSRIFKAIEEMKVINKGVFEPQKDKHYHQIGLIPIEFDISGREMWLRKIQHIKSYMVGSSNYTTDYIEHWNLIFQVNTGIGEGKCSKASEDYLVILEIEIATWCRPKDMVAREVYEGLKDYPIIEWNELLDAFEQRDFYRDPDEYNILPSSAPPSPSDENK